VTARSILVYYANPDEAQAYARLIKKNNLSELRSALDRSLI